MSDIRNNDLCKIIEDIFPKKCNKVDKAKKQVIIGKGKYATKCTFREVDKEYYTTLFKYTFLIEGAEFVDKKCKSYEKFDRNMAVDNAVKYLKSFGINVNCTLYCNSEKVLFARYVFQVINDILSIMFSFGKEFKENKYNEKKKDVKERYNKEIISKGIIALIYQNARWSDVESYKVNAECSDCLLIDSGLDWQNGFDIPYLQTGIKLKMKSNINNGFSFHSEMTFNCDKIDNLQNKAILIREDNFYYLDFFHFENDHYIPNHFCYCADLKNVSAENELEEESKEMITGAHHKLSAPELGSEEFYQAIMYMNKTYCTNNQKQLYINAFSNIAKIISTLLRINYREFYSDDYNISKTVFVTGFEQLSYFLKDHKIDYSKKDVCVIYRYLITLWLDVFLHNLEIFNFEKMFDVYFHKDSEYTKIVDENRRKITDFKSLDILDTADYHFENFCVRNRKVIDSFKKQITYYTYESIEQIIAKLQDSNYKVFDMLRVTIKSLQEKLGFKVNYYERITVVDGKTIHHFDVKYLGYGQVGEKKAIKKENLEEYTVEGPDFITLSFNDNIAEIKYILKPEYIKEQLDDTIVQNSIEKAGTVFIMKKDHKYRIDFEAYGNSIAPFSFIISRRRKDNSFQIVFNRNDIELSSECKMYSFEFTYNGEEQKMGYLAFGYGNMDDDYMIKNIEITDLTERMSNCSQFTSNK